ncbi:MAG: preprotein translocase subunit YajC [Spirochaetales bacterium]|nr:preprotein translocase subunit YajC [Spirochaetales bacterium]
MNTLLSNLPLMMGATEGAAGQSGSEGGGSLVMLVMFAGIILIFYFLIIRPQRKRQKETDKMIAALKKGDRVISIGGIHGTIQSVKDQAVIVKVDDNVTLKFNKTAIHSVVAAGSEQETAGEAEAEKEPKEDSRKKKK